MYAGYLATTATYHGPATSANVRIPQKFNISFSRRAWRVNTK